MTRYISLASRAHVPTTAGMSSEPIPEHEKLGKLRSPQLPSGHIAAAGQSNVILEILFNHLKLSFFKFPISILMIFFNFFFQFLSKDFINYYCGIHCSCVKIK